jgi:hypothetical protein
VLEQLNAHLPVFIFFPASNYRFQSLEDSFHERCLLLSLLESDVLLIVKLPFLAYVRKQY